VCQRHARAVLLLGPMAGDASRRSAWVAARLLHLGPALWQVQRTRFPGGEDSLVVVAVAVDAADGSRSAHRAGPVLCDDAGVTEEWHSTQDSCGIA